MPRMTPEWWAAWGRGLMRDVYPVMSVIMKSEYLDMWLEGLSERLVEEGVPAGEVKAIVYG